jgi:hypothetical protein
VGGWPDATEAFALIAEIVLVSYLIMLENFLSESEMLKIGDKHHRLHEGLHGRRVRRQVEPKDLEVAAILGVDGSISRGASQRVAQTISTRTGSVVDPILKIFLEDYGTSISARSIFEWSL